MTEKKETVAETKGTEDPKPEPKKATTTRTPKTTEPKTAPAKNQDFTFTRGICGHCGVRLRTGLAGEPVCPVLAQGCPRNPGGK